jgi:branched-chain amino acid transport system permease protein
VLIIAVIGGISYFEGAWIGALVYVLLETYTTSIPLIDRIGLTPDRFNTVIGLIVLLIMVLSPEGLVGILERVRRGRGVARPTDHSIEPPTTAHSPVQTTSGQEP